MVVVDTNVVAYLLIEGDRTALAQQLYERDSAWHSEAFVMVEFANILATYVRSKAIAREQALALLADAGKALEASASVAHAEVLETAMRFGISAYDARFITYARQSRAKLVTEDSRLRVAVPEWTMSLEEAAG